MNTYAVLCEVLCVACQCMKSAIQIKFDLLLYTYSIFKVYRQLFIYIFNNFSQFKFIKFAEKLMFYSTSLLLNYKMSQAAL